MNADNFKAAVLQQMVAEAESDLAALHEKAALQEKYVADLRQRLTLVQPLDGDADSAANAETNGAHSLASVAPATGASISARIVQALREVKKPMRLMDIAEMVEQSGAVSAGRKGVMSNVASAIIRRKDLFVKKGRGIYGLKEWETNGRPIEEAAD